MDLRWTVRARADAPARWGSLVGPVRKGRGRFWAVRKGLVFWMDEFVHVFFGTKIKMLLPLGPAVSLPYCDVSLY